MPGKHYKGMPKYKSDKQRMAVHASKAEKKGMPKLSEKQAKHIDTNKDGKISGADFPINKGIGNYKGSGNFAMKNKVLAKSAKYGDPMQKNFMGKIGAALAGPGALLMKKPMSTKDLGKDVTNDPKYKKAKDAGKKVYKSNTGQITTVEGVPNKRKLKKMDKKIKQKQFDTIKKNLSKLSDEELMEMKANKKK
tara:strand:- start:651 stop:1229 length:579 start_codon:yes stop_codon:yes gene_type:complete